MIILPHYLVEVEKLFSNHPRLKCNKFPYKEKGDNLENLTNNKEQCKSTIKSYNNETP